MLPGRLGGVRGSPGPEITLRECLGWGGSSEQLSPNVRSTKITWCDWGQSLIPKCYPGGVETGKCTRELPGAMEVSLQDLGGSYTPICYR